ncbi:MAG: hydrogenase [Treponema sp.]|jgi:nitrogenase molybdenum-iron protein beta chain|nr:hydrogenase [Treponema sp.]
MSALIEQPRFTCALGGQQTVLAIPGARPIVHAGPGCSMKIMEFSSMNAGRQGEGCGGGTNISCTNTYEQEVVFGGEKKLRTTIEGAFKVIKGDLFVVLSGCTADIVGDDTINITKEYAEKGWPIVGVETAGFKGTSYYGHETVVNGIIEQFVGDTERKPREGLVNVFSVVPFQNPYWRGDLENLKSLLQSIGLEVNILFGYGSKGISEWKDIPNAQFNLLVSPWVGFSTVKLLEQKYRIPYLHYPVLPFGAQETSRFLREVGSYAGIPKARVEAVIEVEEKRFYRYLSSIVDFLSEYRSNLPWELYTVADSAYATGASVFLTNELGFIPKGVYIVDDAIQRFQEAVKASIISRNSDFEGLVQFEIDGGLIQQDIRDKLHGSHKALFLGSGWEKFLAQSTGNSCSFLSLPLPETVILGKSFMGYSGGINLTEEIYSDLFKTKAHFSRQTVFIETPAADLCSGKNELVTRSNAYAL